MDQLNHMEIFDATKHDARELARGGVEIWAPCPETTYLISNLGRVFNRKTASFLQQHRGKKGYMSAGGKHVHVMVMLAFDGPSDLVVDHIDTDRAHNHIHNLQYLTRKENAEKTLRSGRCRNDHGTIQPLPPGWEKVIVDVAERRTTRREGSKQLGRSPAWLDTRIQDYRLRDQVQPALSPEERMQARSDAAEGKETFWRPWPKHPRLEVSNLGRVRSTSTKVSIKPNFSGGDKHGSVAGHVYVAVMELYGEPKPYPKATIRHTPNDTGDAISNLQWGSYAEQGKDSIAQGLLPRGSEHARSKLTEALVEEGLKRFVEEAWSISRLEDFLGTESASAILAGESWIHVRRPPGLTEARANRSRLGEKAHNAVCTDAELTEALRLYVLRRWSSIQFACYLKIQQGTAASILGGKTRMTVLRPVGFQFPWPEHNRQVRSVELREQIRDLVSQGLNNTSINERLGLYDHPVTAADVSDLRDALGVDKRISLDERQVQEALCLYVERGWQPRDLAEHLGISLSGAQGIVKGKAWKNLQRPDGFEASRQHKRVRPEEVKEQIRSLVQQGLTAVQINEQLGLEHPVTNGEVTDYRKRLGMAMKAVGRAAGRPPEVKGQIEELVRQGLTASQINEQLKIDPPVRGDEVFTYRKRLGVLQRKVLE